MGVHTRSAAPGRIELARGGARPTDRAPLPTCVASTPRTASNRPYALKLECGAASRTRCGSSLKGGTIVAAAAPRAALRACSRSFSADDGGRKRQTTRTLRPTPGLFGSLTSSRLGCARALRLLSLRSSAGALVSLRPMPSCILLSRIVAHGWQHPTTVVPSTKSVRDTSHPVNVVTNAFLGDATENAALITGWRHPRPPCGPRNHASSDSVRTARPGRLTTGVSSQYHTTPPGRLPGGATTA